MIFVFYFEKKCVANPIIFYKSWNKTCFVKQNFQSSVANFEKIRLVPSKIIQNKYRYNGVILVKK